MYRVHFRPVGRQKSLQTIDGQQAGLWPSEKVRWVGMRAHIRVMSKPRLPKARAFVCKGSDSPAYEPEEKEGVWNY